MAIAASLIKTAAGPIGVSAGAVLVGSHIALPLPHIAVIVAVSVAMGMAAHQAREGGRWSKVLMEAGAITLVAFWLGIRFAYDPLTLAVICMGTGMAGSRVLDVIERVVVRLMGVATTALLGGKRDS